MIDGHFQLRFLGFVCLAIWGTPFLVAQVPDTQVQNDKSDSQATEPAKPGVSDPLSPDSLSPDPPVEEPKADQKADASPDPSRADSASEEPDENELRKLKQLAVKAHKSRNVEKAIELYERVLEKAPTDKYTNYNLALLYFTRADREKLRALVPSIAAHRSDTPITHAIRASILLLDKKYDEAIEAWETARELSPSDQQVDVENDVLLDLDAPEPEEMAAAKEQLMRIAKDLPGLLDDVGEDDPLYQWTVRRMAGQGLGFPVIWDPTEPRAADAEHLPPRGGKPAKIRIARFRKNSSPKGDPMTVDRWWSGLVFELFNLGNTNGFKELMNEVSAGKLRRTYFVLACVNLERSACRKSKAFYSEVYLPHCKKKNLPTNPKDWFGEFWQPPNQSLHRYGTDESKYPWSVFGKMYDRQMISVLMRERSWGEALALAQRQLDSDKPMSKPGRVYWLSTQGYVAFHSGMFDEAIDGYTLALELDSDNIPSRLGRASGFLATKQFDKAVKDIEHVLQSQPGNSKARAMLKAIQRGKEELKPHQ